MSEQYQVLTYRMQRSHGEEKLQRVVIDADAGRVDGHGQLRLTQEVVVDLDAMEKICVTLSPPSSETLPVVMGAAVESQSNETLAWVPGPSQVLLNDDQRTREDNGWSEWMKGRRHSRAEAMDTSAEIERIIASSTLRDVAQTSTHEEIEQLGGARSLRVPKRLAEAPKPRKSPRPLGNCQMITQLPKGWDSFADETPQGPRRRRGYRQRMLALWLTAASVGFGAVMLLRALVG